MWGIASVGRHDTISPDIDASIDTFVTYLAKETTLAKRTVRYYREQCHCAFNILKELRSDILPQNVTKADALWFLDEMDDRGLTVETRKGYFQALRKITDHYNNSVVRKLKVRWPLDTRPNVDWLDFEQAKALMEFPKSPNQELIVHCELCLGLRRCEVARLTPEDFQDTYVNVIGKGSMGGKPRIVPYHPNTTDVVYRYKKYRDAMITVARARYPATTVVPDRMLIWERGARLHAYSEERLSGLDGQINDLSEQVGFHFSNHTLRRTFGRVMYRSGVPVATISKLLGHEDTVTTLRYIGVDMDDMASAMTMYQLR